jgi:hypothetical protein
VKAFEIYVNGERVCTAGVGEGGVLATGVTWVAGASPHPAEGRFDFRIGGVDGVTGEHLSWNAPQLGIGDEIRVKLVEADRTDQEHQRIMPDLQAM